MNKTLLTLIKYSLLPALLLFIGKLAGILFVSGLFNFNVQFSLVDYNIFFFKTLVDSKNYIILSSYSDMFMFLVMMLGMTILLFQALVLHDSHISSNTVFRLAKYNLLDLIKTSFDLYHSGIVWALFMWLSCLLIGLNTLKGATYIWVLGIALVFSISYSIIFIKDLFSEIKLIKNE